MYGLSTDIPPLLIPGELSLPLLFLCPCPLFAFIFRHNHHYLLRVDRDSASTNTVQREESHGWANLKSGTHYSPTALPAPTSRTTYDLS